MMNCRQATRLVSQAMDTKLPWHQRLAVRIHLLYCVWCRRYAAQLQLLRKAAKQLPKEELDTSAQKLSDDAKKRMCMRLNEALKEPPSSSQ
jgi:Putative zinc-finger